MDEATLLDKLRKIEALHAGATTSGEREAARLAAERITARLADLRGREAEMVIQYSLPDPWARKLFLALCRRYGLTPYRRHRQRYSTILLRAPETFQKRTLWPEFQALAEALRRHLDAVSERVIHAAIHGDASEAEEVEEPKGLPGT